MKKLLSLMTLSGALLWHHAILAAINPFSVDAGTPVQNMVAGSSQGIHYVLTSPVPKSSPAIVKCAFTPDNPSQLTYSFNNAGCVTGVGLFKGITVDTLLTLTVPNGVTTTQSGTLTFRQTNGRGYTINIPITVKVATNSQRVITFNNYCTNPAGSKSGAGTTGTDIVIGIISSSVPAKNKATANTQCSTDSDCSDFKFSTCINATSTGPCNGGAGCYCGGGACVNDNDCVNTNAGTCVKKRVHLLQCTNGLSHGRFL